MTKNNYENKYKRKAKDWYQAYKIVTEYKRKKKDMSYKMSKETKIMIMAYKLAGWDDKTALEYALGYEGVEPPRFITNDQVESKINYYKVDEEEPKVITHELRKGRLKFE